MLKSKIGLLAFLFVVLPLSGIMAQTQIKGMVQESTNHNPLSMVKVSIENSNIHTSTDASGHFVLKGNIPLGEQVLTLTFTGYKTKRYPIVVNKGKVLKLGVLLMSIDWAERDLGIAEISLSDNQLDNDRGSVSNISGLLSASKDVYFSAAAYDFSATFFKPRGLDNENGRVLINGIEMNKMTTGRPEFADFGGLNDVKRNQTFYSGLMANPYQFGGIAGTTNSIMRASKYRKGGKISYASSNRSYRGRVMASYSSGLLPSGWAYTFLVSRRFGSHGYTDGTSYNTSSFFASVEKKFNNKQSLNFTAFYAPYKRGKSSPLTQEVRDLKGKHYNPYWGYQNGDVRNARVKEVKEPVFMLNHYWNISPNTRLNTNVAFQFGKTGSTRIDNGGTRIVYGPEGQKAYVGNAHNTQPDYYQNLPSYFLRDEDLTSLDFQKAYLAEQEFINDGQLDWGSLYEANQIAIRNGGNSTYILEEDRTDNTKFTANTILESRLSDHVKLNASLRYRHLHSENFAQVADLLGGKGFLDVDFFADEGTQSAGFLMDLAQSNVNTPDRIVHTGDRYKYNYAINADYGSAFAQAQFNYKRINFFVGADVSHTTYQRDGQYKNGHFPDNSYGKSKKLNFTDFGVKGGALYKITGQHMLRAHIGYLTKAPTIRNIYPNARQNDFSVIGLESEKIQTADLSYLFRSSGVKARITGYYSAIKGATDVSHYFTQGLSGLGADHDAAFVHEATTGINKRNLGVEFGIEAEITPTITVRAAGSFGQSVYTNNPHLYLQSEDFNTSLLHGSQLQYAQDHKDTPVIFGDGTTKLKNYHVSGGPEQAYQIGFEYSDPHYWFIGASANFFSHGYVDISKLRRTANFALAADGLPIVDYDPTRARQLLRQERFNDYMLVNLIGGKSWKINDYYIGVFGVVSNLLDQAYRTGGFESSRKANYTNYNQDQSSPYGAQFGNNYFYGYGTTFYLNVYVRF